MRSIVKYRNVEILRKEHVVLKNVSFDLQQGEFLYLMGKVGSGKSSLLKSIYSEIPISDGTARVFDYDLNNIKRKEIPMLRRQIGIVFQDFQLLTDRNVHENLRFVLEATGWKDQEDIECRIEEVLKQVAMLNKPQLILADEPTGNLDPATSEQIVNHLHEISSNGTAVIMATHNLALVEQFPARVLRCEDKKLI